MLSVCVATEAGLLALDIARRLMTPAGIRSESAIPVPRNNWIDRSRYRPRPLESNDFRTGLASDISLGQAAVVQLWDQPFPKSNNPKPN
jgi:hypothetical protein